MNTKLKATMLAGGLLASLCASLPQPTHAATGGAVWQNNGDRAIATGLTTMQEVTQENFSLPYCGRDKDSIVAVGATLQLKDSRDGEMYTIVKLDDGNCWMQQNSRLMGKTIDSTDSDMTSGSFTVPASDVSGFNSSDQYERKAYYEGNTDNGAYYNWYTATAGAGTSSIATDGVSVDSSICPKGWKLPTSAEYSNLVSKAGFSNGGQIAGPPYNFPYAGYVYSGSLGSTGRYGFYWSRTVSTSSHAYSLRFDSSNIYPARIDSRHDGCSVRCLAVPPSAPIGDSAEANINVIVNPTLSLSLSSNSVSLAAQTDQVVTGKIGAKVTANQPFSIGFSTAAGQTMLSATSAGNSSSIPAKDGLQAGDLGWGIQKKLSATGTRGDATDSGVYSAVGNGDPITFYRSAAGSDGVSPLDFLVGIGVTTTLPADTYSTTVTVTATAG